MNCLYPEVEYYGRCNGGEGEYEQAFKYFSIGHAFGYFESTYKLADMFTHGYGVVKDGHTAYRLYSAVYSENKQRFLAGERTGKFADTALRMGNCYMEGIGVEKDLQEAHTCYLEADLAIRIRVKEANHYGDTSVYSEIQQALQNTRQEYTEHSTAYAEPYPGVFFAKVLSDNRRCRMNWKTLENGKMFLILTPMKLPAEWEVPKMMITYAQGDYCELVDSFMIRTEPGTVLAALQEEDAIVFNRYETDRSSGEVALFYDEVKTGTIKSECYTFIVPDKEETVKEGQEYRFAGIRFKPEGRRYDYLCDLPDVAAGDMVMVNGYDGVTAVEVVEVFSRYESELTLPLERYKKILRKA